MPTMKTLLALFLLVLSLLSSLLQGAPGYGLSSFPEDRPIVMGYVNGLRSATGGWQSL
ncbi:MAG: hypothetical protein GWO81_01425, partial [Verrucomicrobia bacterium]|nr:hypothetical protein [Verrucomicrobiota bacterium]